jgi:hypothetical protein
MKSALATNTTGLTPTFAQLKRAFLESGYEIRRIPRQTLEGMALDAPSEVKRHLNTNIMGLIVPDENIIAIARELDNDEAATTLLHEMIHLWNEDLDEDLVENMTLELEQTIPANQFGFLQFLVS